MAVSVVAILKDLADDLERGAIGPHAFADALVGFACAYEGTADDFYLEAMQKSQMLDVAVEQATVNVDRFVVWLREWTKRLPE
jgi:hypothetical protein